MLGISTRRLLIENALPTIFSYTTPTQKRKTTERRRSCSTKRQLIDDANVETNVEMELNDKENLLIENSKPCQTETAIPSVRSISTQTNASEIVMIEENEDHIATLYLSMQSN